MTLTHTYTVRALARLGAMLMMHTLYSLLAMIGHRRYCGRGGISDGLVTARPTRHTQQPLALRPPAAQGGAERVAHRDVRGVRINHEGEGADDASRAGERGRRENPSVSKKMLPSSRWILRCGNRLFGRQDGARPALFQSSSMFGSGERERLG